MKKNFLMSIVVAALVVFGVKTYYDKKTTNNDQVSVEKENKDTIKFHESLGFKQNIINMGIPLKKI